MTLFYRAFIESIVSFSLVSWFGSLSIKNRNSLNQVVKWSSKLVGESQPNPASLYTRQVQRITESILNHRLHPLHKEFQLLPSGKRFLVPRFKTKRFKNSFVPAAITLKNKLQKLLDLHNIHFVCVIYLFVDFLDQFIRVLLYFNYGGQF